MEVLEALKIAPDYDPDLIRTKYFSRLKDEVYLDHAGAALYNDLQLTAVMAELKNNLLGNPHSRNRPSENSTQILHAARQRILRHFNTSEEEYAVIFTSGASAAIKLVAENFRWAPTSDHNCCRCAPAPLEKNDANRAKSLSLFKLPSDLNERSLSSRADSPEGDSSIGSSSSNALGPRLLSQIRKHDSSDKKGSPVSSQASRDTPNDVLLEKNHVCDEHSSKISCSTCFSSASCFVYTQENHTSVLGIRGCADAAGAAVVSVSSGEVYGTLGADFGTSNSKNTDRVDGEAPDYEQKGNSVSCVNKLDDRITNRGKNGNSKSSNGAGAFAFAAGNDVTDSVSEKDAVDFVNEVMPRDAKTIGMNCNGNATHTVNESVSDALQNGNVIERNVESPCTDDLECLSGRYQNCLFAYSAQCNYSGVKHPLTWVDQVHRGALNGLLDRKLKTLLKAENSSAPRMNCEHCRVCSKLRCSEFSSKLSSSESDTTQRFRISEKFAGDRKRVSELESSHNFNGPLSINEPNSVNGCNPINESDRTNGFFSGKRASEESRTDMESNSTGPTTCRCHGGNFHKPRRRWFVLLDAASLVATSPLDLSTTSPDFVPVSFYKMFGYPTGLGCLLLHRRAWSCLDKRYFGGGTVELADSRSLHTVFRRLPCDRYEDGTVSFLAIASLRHGFDTLAQLCGGMRNISSHVHHVARYVHHSLRSYRHANGARVARVYGTCGRTWAHATHGSIVNFNVFTCTGEYVGFTHIERVASIYNIHLRTGCVCNPGSCQTYLHISSEALRQQHLSGHVCGDSVDTIDGHPTGSVRVSFGYSSTYGDADQLLRMVRECFVQGPLQVDTSWMPDAETAEKDVIQRPESEGHEKRRHTNRQISNTNRMKTDFQNGRPSSNESGLMSDLKADAMCPKSIISTGQISTRESTLSACGTTKSTTLQCAEPSNILYKSQVKDTDAREPSASAISELAATEKISTGVKIQRPRKIPAGRELSCSDRSSVGCEEYSCQEVSQDNAVVVTDNTAEVQDDSVVVTENTVVVTDNIAEVTNNTVEVTDNTVVVTDNTVVVTDIKLYPVKSCGAMSVGEWPLGERGLLYDRHWMVVTRAGLLVTLKRLPRMSLVAPFVDLRLRRLVLSYPGRGSVSVPLDAAPAAGEEAVGLPCSVRLCGARVPSRDCGEEVAEWLSYALEAEDLRLLRQSGPRQRRATPGSAVDVAPALSLANEAQLLLLHRPSVRRLLQVIRQGRRDPAPHDEESLVARMRGNVVFDGGKPFDEDVWVALHNSDLTIKVGGLCERCQMVAVTPDTGERSLEPLLSLKTLRGARVTFGVLASTSASNQAKLSVGMRYQVTVDKREKT